MEPKQSQDKKESQPATVTPAVDEHENVEKPFCERPYEEVEDGYIDDRGFYTTPNGSFWDDEHTYFNRLGFDRHGGTYDKYGIYQPGAGYDENTGLYNDQKEFMAGHENEMKDVEKNIELSISKLKEQEKRDEKTIKKYENLEEESEDSDDDDKSNATYDDNDIKEAYDFVMENENRNENILPNASKTHQEVNGQ